LWQAGGFRFQVVVTTLQTPSFQMLPWQPDAAQQTFAALADEPWAMLLHSGFADHPHNRFDILVADPRATVMTRGSQTTRFIDGVSSEHSGDPLAIVQQTLDSFGFTPQAHADLPFLGGALGLFGYDLGRHFEKIPQLAQASLNTPDMAVGIYDWALIADHRQKRLTLLCWGDISARLSWLHSRQLPQREPFRLTSGWQSNMTREQYGRNFRQVQEYLRSGDCYQVNLAQRFSASYAGCEWQAFQKLNQANRAPFSAFIRLEASAILSLSPERFILLEGKNIQTRPIKGTLPRLANAEEDAQQAEKLAHSPKDRAENLMIVDLLRNDIGRVAVPGSVRVPELFVVEPFPAVHHLVSTITAELPEALQATDLLRACFPGGSITGAPKVRAMEIIEELEPQRRNAWCGSVGYISFCGKMDTSITIRTITAEAGKLYCPAGGGVVADSTEDSEYQETFDKVNRILPVLEN
jgi:para-aminobenzoate synthetase component 1